MSKKLYHQFKYVTDNVPDALKEQGIFIAVKVLNLFTMTYANEEKLTYSNAEIINKLGIKRESSLHSAFKILEADGVLVRTFKDEEKRVRGEFKLDIDKVLSWMKTTIYDEAYRNGQRRSLFRHFVNQTRIIIEGIRDRVIAAVGKRRTADRKAQIKAIAEKCTKLYSKYLKFLETRAIKQQKINSSRKDNMNKNMLVNAAAQMLQNLFGYVPPETTTI